MAILQVRDIDDQLYAALKTIAGREKRSLSQEVIHILQQHLNRPSTLEAGQTEAFLRLSGAFEDEEAESLVRSIRRSRRNSRRFTRHGLFD